jgi:lipid A 4'-phosphatase
MQDALKAGLIAVLGIAALTAFFLWPHLDLTIAGLFADPQKGFVLGLSWPVIALGKTAYWGARLMGAILVVGSVAALIKRGPVLGFPVKAWFFLLVTLLLGPGLVTNVVFKDNWGRARPREVMEFGGTSNYTPPFVISEACDKNCSFIAGDAAFGFYLPGFAYVVPRKRSRRVFWSGMFAGCIFGLSRVIAGAHFLSDVIFAALFMLLISALAHTLMFGLKGTKERWRLWLPLFTRLS